MGELLPSGAGRRSLRRRRRVLLQSAAAPGRAPAVPLPLVPATQRTARAPALWALAASLALHAAAVGWLPALASRAEAPERIVVLLLAELADASAGGESTAPNAATPARTPAARPSVPGPARRVVTRRPSPPEALRAEAARDLGVPVPLAPHAPPVGSPPRGVTAARSTTGPTEPDAGIASGSATGPVSGVLPRGGYQVRPRYPARARRLGLEGRSVLLVRIARSGRVEELRVVASAGMKEMDRAALDAVRRWRFEPIDADLWVRIPIDFQIR